ENPLRQDYASSTQGCCRGPDRSRSNRAGNARRSRSNGRNLIGHATLKFSAAVSGIANDSAATRFGCGQVVYFSNQLYLMTLELFITKLAGEFIRVTLQVDHCGDNAAKNGDTCNDHHDDCDRTHDFASCPMSLAACLPGARLSSPSGYSFSDCSV